jgi:hypothetical protein
MLYHNGLLYIHQSLQMCTAKFLPVLHMHAVRTHLATGRRTLLDKTWEFVALHKDRSIFPIRLTVHLISGLGEDSVVSWESGFGL